jgi:hypothetical protein
MDYKRRQNRRWVQRMLIFLVFGLFTARAQAGLVAPTVTVSTSSTNVSIGDNVTITVVAHCNLGVLSSVSCLFGNGNGSLPTNTVFSILSGVINIDSTITNTLTISHITSASAGTYTVQYADLLGLLNLSTTVPININILPTIKAVVGGSGMVQKGFKILFSAPTGSNVVVEASSDLSSWSPLCTNVVANGSLTYTDAVAKTVSCRFYRAKIQ